ncbi:MAG: hypothetical protein ACKPKO_31930 [Candidatus Fonsibacter sp.]
MSGAAHTTRAIISPVSDEDIGVFIQPENGVAAVAATESSSNDIIPRHVVVKNLIKHRRAKIREFDNAIGELIDSC